MYLSSRVEFIRGDKGKGADVHNVQRAVLVPRADALKDELHVGCSDNEHCAEFALLSAYHAPRG